MTVDIELFDLRVVGLVRLGVDAVDRTHFDA
jgi:hypothetical protein